MAELFPDRAAVLLPPGTGREHPSRLAPCTKIDLVRSHGNGRLTCKLGGLNINSAPVKTTTL
jgi:hypothetical protein